MYLFYIGLNKGYLTNSRSIRSHRSNGNITAQKSQGVGRQEVKSQLMRSLTRTKIISGRGENRVPTQIVFSNSLFSLFFPC